MNNLVSTSEERQFYLDSFRRRTLLFASPAGPLAYAGRPVELIRTLEALVCHGGRALLLVGHAPASAPLARVREIVESAAGAYGSLFSRGGPVVGLTDPGDEEALAAVWRRFSEGCGVVLLVSEAPDASLWRIAAGLAVRLRVAKLILLDPAGGVLRPGGEERLSFLDAQALAQLLRGEGTRQADTGRREILAAVSQAIAGGVGSVNLCDLAGVERELFTYEGTGTLFTAGSYCRVERLGIDEFGEVQQLIAKGQKEGFLRVRNEAEIARVLLTGYGARIGEGQLAGLCALETRGYEREAAGEIAALYTITRFKGEGVGTRLLERVLSEAAARGLRYVFACAVDKHASQFFERHGFHEAGPEAVPAAKWVDYDPLRRGRVRIWKRFLVPRGEAVPGNQEREGTR